MERPSVRRADRQGGRGAAQGERRDRVRFRPRRRARGERALIGGRRREEGDERERAIALSAMMTSVKNNI
eukprot:31185-Pelagococcus_subviridis.AAC.11